VHSESHRASDDNPPCRAQTLGESNHNRFIPDAGSGHDAITNFFKLFADYLQVLTTIRISGRREAAPDCVGERASPTCIFLLSSTTSFLACGFSASKSDTKLPAERAGAEHLEACHRFIS
jgi:hypothetical protein